MNRACGMSTEKNVLQLPLKLTHVTVFLRGAELLGSGEIELPAGECEVVLSGVASAIHEQSLSVSASSVNGGGVTILSTRYETDYLEEGALTAAAQAIKTKLEAKQLERERVEVQVRVLEEQVATLQANRQMVRDGSPVALSVSELGAMVDFMAERTEKAWDKQVDLNVRMQKLDEEIAKLTEQLEEENGQEAQPMGKVVLQLLAEKAVKTQISLSYLTYDVSWQPTYDLRVDEVGSPVRLVYKARLFQNTGLHWEDVLLTLSSGNPSQGAQAPVLHPWYLRKEVPYAAAAGGMMRSMVAEVAEMAAPVKMMARAKSVESDTLSLHVTTNTQGLHVSFEIALPYTIPSDGKEHLVMIQDARVEADYYYLATPKLDRDVFLQAKVEHWQDLNLMPGQSNIYFEGTYVGQGHIDLAQMKDGMVISLGREKRIWVERVEDENNREKAGLLGGSVQRTFAYTINAQNARPDAVKLRIKDQLPMSQDSEISVMNLELAGAKHDEKTGMLEWEVLMQPKEKKEIAFSYAVKYARDVHIEGL